MRKKHKHKKLIRLFIRLLIVILAIYSIYYVSNELRYIIYPLKYQEIVSKYSEEYEIDPLLIYSIIKTESNFKEDAKSKSNAIGLMQVMLSTAKEMGDKLEIEEITEEQLYIPETNIRIGIKYFKILLEKYNNYNLAIIAYNAGMGNVDNWLENGIIDGNGENIEDIPFPETKNYVKKILQNYKIYKEIYR